MIKVYGLPKIFDHQIVAVNCKTKENESATMIYKDRFNELHTIDLASCAKNFQDEYPKASGKCVGDRNIVSGYFVFYTSGLHTFVLFKKHYVFNFFGKRLFSGSRNSRFNQLKNLLLKAGYTTYDLS